MIPLKLQVRNFMCYHELDSLDFSGIDLARVAGDNGRGKSALLDAMTWALWGKARAKRDDELIHLGQTEMEVEFEFALGENHYRVIRKRDSRGRGQSSLELHVRDPKGILPAGFPQRDFLRGPSGAATSSAPSPSPPYARPRPASTGSCAWTMRPSSTRPFSCRGAPTWPRKKR